MTSYRVRIIGGIDNSVVNSLILPSDCLSVPKHRCLYTLHVACGNSTPFIPSPMDQSLSSPLTQTHHYSAPDTWSPLSITKMKMQRKPRSSTSPSSEHRKKYLTLMPLLCHSVRCHLSLSTWNNVQLHPQPHQWTLQTCYKRHLRSTRSRGSGSR